MRRSWNTGVWPLALALALTLGWGQVAAAQPAPPSDPAAVLAAFEQGVGNSQAVEAQLALVADNAVQRIVPAPQGTTGVWTGKAELRQAFAYAVTHKVTRVLVGSPEVNGNNVTDTALTTNDFFLLLGVAPVKFTTVAVVEGGKITSYTTTIAPEERARVGAAIAAYQRAHAPQPPPGMPATGDGALAGALAALVMAGLLCLGTGLLVRRAQARA